MIRTILFDFDGVIMDSMKIKGDGFRELFSDYDEQDIQQLEAYHYANGGVSRFEKIRYFYRDILKAEVDEATVLTLAEKFGAIVARKLFDPGNLISETVVFIRANVGSIRFHIVSGAEETELRSLCDFFGIADLFISIKGSPTKKEILVREILEGYGYAREETILIGDSINDYHAAEANGIGFYGYNNPELKRFPYIESFEHVRFDV